MKEFTIREIIEYAANIESESHKFYTNAASKATDPDTKQLAKELSEEETDHYNHLLDLLSKERVTSSELDKLVDNVDLSDRVVKTDEIDFSSDPIDVLEVALEREINTERLYSTYLTFTDLPEDVIKVFEDLKNQEIGHQNRIKAIIKKITG